MRMRHLRRYIQIYQGFIVSGVILIFCTAALFIAVIPGIGATVKLYESQKQISKDIQSLTGKRAFLDALPEDDLQKHVVTLLSALPQEKTIPTLLSTIEGLANQTGVSITNISITSPGSIATGAATTKEVVDKKIAAFTLPFSFDVKGTNGQIREFVGIINKVRRLFSVKSLQLSVQKNGEILVHVELVAYYQPLPTKVGSVQTPVSALSQKEEEMLGTLIEYPDLSQGYSQSLEPMLSEGKRDPFAH